MALVSWSRASAACQQSRAKLFPREIVEAPAGIIAVTPAIPATAAVKRAFIETSSHFLWRDSPPSNEEIHAFCDQAANVSRQQQHPIACGASTHGAAGHSSGPALRPSPAG